MVIVIGKRNKYLNKLFSEPCENGKYRSTEMTECEECDEGKIPNSDQTVCGKSKTTKRKRLKSDWHHGVHVIMYLTA